MKGDTPVDISSRVAELRPLIEPIQGWCEFAAGVALYQLARVHAPIPVAVELGVWKGRSLSWLAFGVQDRDDGPGEVYGVDTWTGTPGENAHTTLLSGYGQDQLYEEFLQNVQSLGLTNVTPIRASTVDASTAWTRPIGVLSIDAGHEYLDVRSDFERWSPWVISGGFIIFDDVPHWPGPTRLVSELPRWWRYIGMAPNKWIVQRVD